MYRMVLYWGAVIVLRRVILLVRRKWQGITVQAPHASCQDGHQTSLDFWNISQFEPLSKLLVSPLISPIILPYIIPYITPFKEFRL